MKRLPPPVRLERLLEILSEEIATASDEEVMDACADLKINPRMKGTMAFIGVKGLYFPYRPQIFPPFTDSSVLPDANEGPDLSPRPRQ
jgi:hypothetical protein